MKKKIRNTIDQKTVERNREYEIDIPIDELQNWISSQKEKGASIINFYTSTWGDDPISEIEITGIEITEESDADYGLRMLQEEARRTEENNRRVLAEIETYKKLKAKYEK